MVEPLVLKMLVKKLKVLEHVYNKCGCNALENTMAFILIICVDTSGKEKRAK